MGAAAGGTTTAFWILVVVAIGTAIWYFWPKGGGGGAGGGKGTTPGSETKGDCKDEEGVDLGNISLQMCKGLGGTEFRPNDKTMQAVNPQTGKPL